MRGGKSKRRRHTGWRTFLLGAVIVAVLFVFNLRHPKILEFAELKANDLRMYARPGRKPLGVVAIAAIDDKSVAELGRWPWPRSVMAHLVDSLRYYQVKVIAFDVIFSETDNADAQRAVLADRLKKNGVPEAEISHALEQSNDGAFANAIRAQSATILGYPFANHGMDLSKLAGRGSGFLTGIQIPPPLAYGIVLKAPGPPPPILTAAAYRPPITILLKAAKSTAFVDIDSDLDGVMRSELTVIRFDGRYCVPMFLAAASAYRNNASLALSLSSAGVLRVALGDERIPVDEMGRMLVDFRGGAGTFPHYSAADIIARRVAPTALKGKIVLVGVTGHGLGDRIVTPVGANYAAVQLHANAIDDVLAGTFVRRSKVSAGEERTAAVVLGLAVSLAAGFLSALWSAGIAILLFAGYFIYAQLRLTADGVLVGVIFPLVTLAVTYALLASYRYATEGVEKRRLRHAFEHYLHPDVIASVVDHPHGLRLGGERRHLSILFCDIVNFTARAERSEPEALVAMLNAYMTVMTDLILKGDGVVDKLMGDGIMAFWGAPLALENPARSALDCALEMIEQLARLRLSDSRFQDFDIGIGIATGEAIVGNFGGERRFDYSVIGDTVNLASRLEGLTRTFGVRLITTLKTLEEAGADYLIREIGLVKVKGKEEKVAVAEIAGRAGGSDKDFYKRYAHALGMIRDGANSDATAALDALLSEQPNDKLISLLIEKLRAGEIRSPGDILFEFDTK